METLAINPRPPIGQISVDSALLAKRLAQAEMGQLIKYDELNAIIHRDVQNGAYSNLQRARIVVQRENKMVFGTVSGEGIVRLTDEQIAESYRAPVAHIRRTASKAGKAVVCADMTKLKPEAQRSVSTGLSIVGAIALFSSNKSIQCVQDAAKPAAIPAKINVEEIIGLFAKK